VNIPGYLVFDWDGGNSSKIALPCVIMSLPDSVTLQGYWSEGYNITVQITSEDNNPWLQVADSGVLLFYSIFLGGFALGVIIVALFKFISLVKYQKCHMTLPHLILFFEMLGNADRLVAVTVDPLQLRLVFPDLVNQFFFTTSWPFTILTTILLAFYWHELIHKTDITVNTFLHKLKVPFWIIATVLIAIEFTISLLRGLAFQISPFITAVGVIYVVINTTAVIFFFVTGTKITKLLRKSERLQSRKTKKLWKTTVFIYSSSIGIIIWTIAVVLGGLTPLFWIPWGYFSLWFIVFFVLIFISLNQVLAIHVPKSKKDIVPNDDRNSVRRTCSPGLNNKAIPENVIEIGSKELSDQNEDKVQETLETTQINSQKSDLKTAVSDGGAEEIEQNDEVSQSHFCYSSSQSSSLTTSTAHVYSDNDIIDLGPQ
jgi:ABC-type multidrug transport system fused ATPase/permease subunit